MSNVLHSPRVALLRKMTFHLLLEYANNNGSAGNRYEVHVGGEGLFGDALGTRNWATYRMFPVGEVTLEAGVHRLEVRARPR